MFSEPSVQLIVEEGDLQHFNFGPSVMRVSIFHNSIKNALGQTQPKMVCPADANLASKVIFEGGAHSHIIAKLIYEKSSRFIGLFG